MAQLVTSGYNRLIAQEDSPIASCETGKTKQNRKKKALTNILNMFAILRGNILEDILSCGTWGNVAASSTAADAPMTSES